MWSWNGHECSNDYSMRVEAMCQSPSQSSLYVLERLETFAPYKSGGYYNSKLWLLLNDVAMSHQDGIHERSCPTRLVHFGDNFNKIPHPWRVGILRVVMNSVRLSLRINARHVIRQTGLQRCHALFSKSQ